MVSKKTKPVKIPKGRLDYIKELWAEDLCLIFDGDLLHIGKDTYVWKTGQSKRQKNIDISKRNTHLSTRHKERIRHILNRIIREWYKENQDMDTEFFCTNNE